MKQMTKEEFMNHDKWYHTTDLWAFQNIIKNGIQANINSDVPTDFGYGFYLCPTIEWSEKYAKSFPQGIIIEFNFTPIDLMSGHSDKEYEYFEHLNYEFADFVFANRKFYLNYPSKCVHNYLIVGGVMSDGEQINDFAEYDNNLISKEELYRRLLLPKEDWQLLIHSQEICNLIRPVSAFDLGGNRYDVSSYTPYN